MTNYARDLSEPGDITDFTGNRTRKRIMRNMERAKPMSTKVENNCASNIVQAARMLRKAVNESNINETVTIAAEIEQMANDFCIYLERLSEEMRKTGQTLALSWTDWLREKREAK